MEPSRSVEEVEAEVQLGIHYYDDDHSYGSAHCLRLRMEEGERVDKSLMVLELRSVEE